MDGIENEYECMIHELSATHPELIPPYPSYLSNQATPTTQATTCSYSQQQQNNNLSTFNQDSLNNNPEDINNNSTDPQQFYSQQNQPQQQQLPQQKQQHFSINEMMHSAFVELRMIVEWARKVPNFATLQMGDRVSLLKSSFVDLFLIRLSFRSVGVVDQLTFAENMSLTYDQCVTLGWNPDVIRACFSLVEEMRGKLIDLNEFAVLCAVMLFYPDAPTLSNRLQVLTFQNSFISCLQHYSSNRFHSDHTRPGKLILQLAGMRSVSAGVLDQFIVCTREGQVQMDDLVIEMMS